MEKLKYYKELEDEGRLIILPCAVGTRIYKILYMTDQFDGKMRYMVHEDVYNLDDGLDYDGLFYFSKEEAQCIIDKFGLNEEG